MLASSRVGGHREDRVGGPPDSDVAVGRPDGAAAPFADADRRTAGHLRRHHAAVAPRRAPPIAAGLMSELPIDPARTALVLSEYQNEFTPPGGVLHDAVAPVMESTRMLDNTVELVEKARAAGVTIMHAPITFAPGYGELTRHPYGILKGVVDSNAFVKGTWGAAIVEIGRAHV